MDRRVDMIGYSRRAATRGRQLRRCIGIVLLWLLFGGIGAAGAAALSLWLGGAVPAAWLLAAMLLSAVILFTVPYFILEYDYEISDGVFTVAAIFGRRRRRVRAQVDLRNVDSVAPLDDDVLRRMETARPAVTIDTRSVADSPEASAMLFADKRGRLTLLLFDGGEKFMKAARFYCPSALRR